MRHITIYICLLAAILTLGGCQNNGDIGYLYGTWRFESFTVDGEPQTVAEHTTVSFQNDIILVQRVLDAEMSYLNYFGRWSESGDVMTVDFAQTVGGEPVDAPAYLGWSGGAPMEMRVSDRSDRSMTWTYSGAADGAVRVYRLRKTY
ncbi:MAG: lipocalin-like domain-containing protein [Bacteroides sp.]|nr:lipocalin-like domain-containing protein [Bacteroides sp.]MCM1096130.1 lipocalin-like domain-containing protein [Terasakiella sp.]